MAEGPEVAREFGVETYRLVDHRAGLRHVVDGIDGFIENIAVFDDLRQGDDDYEVFRVVAQRGERLALVDQGVEGSFEVHTLFLHEFDDDGRAIRGDIYEWADLAEAMAELDRRFVGSSGNTAVRSYLEFVRRWMDDGADAVRGVLADDYRFVDHRQGLGSVIEGVDAIVENLRNIDEMREGERFEVFGVLAWRGERLALVDRGIDSERAVVRDVAVVEVDADGLVLAVDLYDTDALAEALDELDRRFAEGEGRAFETEIEVASAGGRAIAAGDPEAVAALLTDDFVFVDHRPIGWGEQDRDSYLAAIAARPDTLGRGVTIARELHPRPGAFLSRHEIRTDMDVAKAGITVAKLRGDRVERMEVFAEGDLAAAEARFDELSATSSENLAARRAREFVRRWMADGPQAAGPMLTDGYRMVDHRAGFGDEIDSREGFLVNLEAIDEVRGEQEYEVFRVIAERGERLVLADQGFDGDFDVHSLIVTEVDANGLAVGAEVFDPEDLVAALDELDRRYTGGEGADHPAVTRVIAFLHDEARRDWDASRTHYAPDFRAVDHRPMGHGDIGVDERVERDRALAEMMPGVHSYVVWAESIGRVALMRVVWVDLGGDAGFERYSHVVVRVDEDGLADWTELFGEDDLAAARARYEELVAEG
jgi:hypothetical protein